MAGRHRDLDRHRNNYQHDDDLSEPALEYVDRLELAQWHTRAGAGLLGDGYWDDHEHSASDIGRVEYLGTRD
jgi:hypothetical protein